VFFRFVWTVIDLAERMLGVADHVANNIEGLRHGSDPLLIFLETTSSENNASLPLGFPVSSLLTLPSRLSKLFQDNLTCPIVKCSTLKKIF